MTDEPQPTPDEPQPTPEALALRARRRTEALTRADRARRTLERIALERQTLDIKERAARARLELAEEEAHALEEG